MAEKKKQGKFHSIHIRPMAGTHYSVHHEPVHEPAENAAMPTIGGGEEKNEKLFAHGERAGLHQHLDQLLDAHEGKAAHHQEPDSDDMPIPADHLSGDHVPADHPMHKLKRKAM